MADIQTGVVLTGDVINSSEIGIDDRETLLENLKETLANTAAFLPDFKAELFQGDSFQGYTVKEKSKALKGTLYIVLIMLSKGFGIRIAMGAGDISFQTDKSLTSDGTAFRHSGRNMELLKKSGQWLSLGADDENINDEWLVHMASLNFLLKRCSALQAEAIVAMLEDKTQQEAADHLQVKQPAIQQRLQSAGWPVIQTILSRFETQF